MNFDKLFAWIAAIVIGVSKLGIAAISFSAFLYRNKTGLKLSALE